MSTFPTESRSSFARIDVEIRALTDPDLHTQLPAALGDRIDHLLEVYRAVRPLLIAVSEIALLPPRWRTAVTLFTQSLDAVASGVAASKDFKAGKDL